MTFNEYQLLAESTAIFKHEYYPYAALMIEAAELADLTCKPVLRGDNKGVDLESIKKEAGDVLWNLAVVLKRCNIKLEDVAIANIDKLADRQKRGVIKGDGDTR